MYKKASQQKLRFETTVGLLTVEQLWDLPLKDLDALAVALEDSYKTSNEKSFLIKKTVKNKTFKLKFDIVLDVLNTKIEERDNLLSARANKEHNAKIDELIAEKQDANLKGKTIKQLENMKK